MEREKLIEAAKMLQENCEQNHDNEYCHGCPFLFSGMCVIDYEAWEWDLSEVQDDV